MNNDGKFDDEDISLLKRLMLTIVGTILVGLWCILVILDMPGVLWEEGGLMIVPLYTVLDLNPLVIGLALLGFSVASGGKKKEESQ